MPDNDILSYYQTRSEDFLSRIEQIYSNISTSKSRINLNMTTNVINNIVYNLLTGCGTNFLNLTLKDTVKDKLAPYVALLEAQQQLNAYTDPNTGNVIYTG